MLEHLEGDVVERALAMKEATGEDVEWRKEAPKERWFFDSWFESWMLVVLHLAPSRVFG